MDKTGIAIVSLCVILLGWYFVEQNKIAQQVAQQQAQFAATNKVAVAQNQTNAIAANTSTVATPMIFNTNSPEQIVILTNAHARYTFTSRGGGLEKIELLDFPDTISARWKGQIHDSDRVASLNTRAPVPVLAVLGDASLIDDGNFILTPIADGVRAEKILTNGLAMTKEFHLSSNYLVEASVSLKNTSDKSLLLAPQEIVIGTATPMDADDSGQLLAAMWCDGTNAASVPVQSFSGGGFGCTRGAPKTEVRGGSGDVFWASAQNQFFALVGMAQSPAAEMVARPVTLPYFQDSGAATNLPPPRGIQTALVYPAQTLTANSSVERQIVLFAGPKEFRKLAVIGDQFHNHAELVMNFGSGFGSFWGIGTFFAKLLLSGMNALHDVTKIGYGWTIVIITIFIRVLFWPLTAKSTRSMKKMQLLQPEIAALKEKYKDDQQKFVQKQMELWKKNGVSPMSGCLPMLVQMPVFLGFFTMIRSAIELRGASFLWAADLSKPDTLFMIPGVTFVPFISTPEGLPFNLLPIMMVSVMLWQSHVTPPSPGMDPSQQKMMRWIPAIFILLFYNYSSGLALYMTVSTLLGIMQTKLTKNIMATPALTPAPKSKK